MPVEERFWSKVDKNGPVPPHMPHLGPCWLWTGSAPGGYGAIRFGSRYLKTHRVAWFLRYQVWPELQILHHCDNPRCVRVDHLFEGTNDANVLDKVSKGRCASMPGESNPAHVLTEDDVREVRRANAAGEPKKWIGARLGVSHQTVRNIVRGKKWRHVS